MHTYEVRPRSDKRGFDLISNGLPFGRRCYGEPNAISNAIGYAKFFSRSHDAVIRVYDSTGNVIDSGAGFFDSGLLKVCFVAPYRYAQRTDSKTQRIGCPSAAN